MAGGKHVLGKRSTRHIFGTVRVGDRGPIGIPKEARSLFGISPGDTLLLLGDEEHGIFISRPGLMDQVAADFFAEVEEKKNAKQ